MCLSLRLCTSCVLAHACAWYQITDSPAICGMLPRAPCLCVFLSLPPVGYRAQADGNVTPDGVAQCHHPGPSVPYDGRAGRYLQNAQGSHPLNSKVRVFCHHRGGTPQLLSLSLTRPGHVFSLSTDGVLAAGFQGPAPSVDRWRRPNRLALHLLGNTPVAARTPAPPPHSVKVSALRLLPLGYCCHLQRPPCRRIRGHRSCLWISFSTLPCW